jgi:hypothetical protein
MDEEADCFWMIGFGRILQLFTCGKFFSKFHYAASRKTTPPESLSSDRFDVTARRKTQQESVRQGAVAGEPEAGQRRDRGIEIFSESKHLKRSPKHFRMQQRL